MIVFVISAGMLIAFTFQPLSDIDVHLNHIIKINHNQAAYPANFLFYFLVNLFSGFSNGKCLYWATILLLTAACIAKYLLSKLVFIHLNMAFKDNYLSKRTNVFMLVMLALFFCFAIPDPFTLLVLKKMYLSRFVPTVWHNSTTILLFPFAILLFYKQLKLLNSAYKPSLNDILQINLLVILNIIIKPSFVFTYVPATFFFLVFNKDAWVNVKSLIVKLTPLVSAALIVLLQYYFFYTLQQGSFYKQKSEIALSFPFELLMNYVPVWYIPFTFIFSFAFVIYAVWAYKDILSYTAFKYALVLTLVGIVISALLIETGPRYNHGNFLWQNVICTFLLFLSTVAYLAPKILIKNTWTRPDKILCVLFFLHALSGIAYIINILITASPY